MAGVENIRKLFMRDMVSAWRRLSRRKPNNALRVDVSRQNRDFILRAGWPHMSSRALMDGI